MKKRSLLIIDDDQGFLMALKDHFSVSGMEVHTAATGREGLLVCKKKLMDVVILDQKLPDVDGDNICKDILNFNDKCKIIFCTAYPSFESAERALNAGAFWYVSKPVDLRGLTFAVKRSLRELDLEKGLEDLSYAREKELEELELIGSSGLKREIDRFIDLAASTDSPVLITGETGTGKTNVARLIHKKSSLKGPFVTINCAVLPENLIEEELFGHKKGAFTGAIKDKRGLFEVADEGTLLLDEIGDMPLLLQSKLLSVIDERKIRRLGDVVYRNTGARIIAATNADIDRKASENAFRKDLYYRLNVIRIHLPPLRERKEDIPEIANYFLRGMSNGKPYRISDEELMGLQDYIWEGNIRELRNVIERAMIIAEGYEIKPSKILNVVSSRKRTPEVNSKTDNGILKLKDLERKHILKVLDTNGGNVSKTARDLGLSLSTLKRRLKSYGFFGDRR
jgi:DNA-binding NtrC family response regulator